VTRSTPLGTQPTAAFLAPFDTSEPGTAGRSQIVASGRGKKASRFSTVLGGLVQQEHQQDKNTTPELQALFTPISPVAAKEAYSGFNPRAANGEHSETAPKDIEGQAAGPRTETIHSGPLATLPPVVTPSLPGASLPDDARAPKAGLETDAGNIAAGSAVPDNLSENIIDHDRFRSEAPLVDDASSDAPVRQFTSGPPATYPENLDTDGQRLPVFATDAQFAATKAGETNQEYASHPASISATSHTKAASSAVTTPDEGATSRIGNASAEQLERVSAAASTPLPQLASPGPLQPYSGDASVLTAPVLFSPIEHSDLAMDATSVFGPENESVSSHRPTVLAFRARLTPVPEAAAAIHPVSDASAATPTSGHGGEAPHYTHDEQPPIEDNHKTADPPVSKDSLKSSLAEIKAAEPPAQVSQPGVMGPFVQAPNPQVQLPGDAPVETVAIPHSPAAVIGGNAPVPVNPPATPARDIQLQLNQGEQRVDVRLTERGGEVHVAVRTPDTELAGSLRDDLPRLSARLEQTGFRAETWHPALSEVQPGIERRQPTAGSSFSDPQRRDGQNQTGQGNRQQQPPRQPKSNPASTADNSQQKEFRWLMSQLP
jgi:hypothetical protein